MPSPQPSADEAALSPGLSIIDTHQHFWGEGHAGAAKFGRFLADDLTATIEESGHDVTATVYVDCGWSFRTSGPEHLRPVGETEYVEAIARKRETASHPVCKMGAGIVGRADLMLGNAAAEVLEAHLAASPSRFRGIRELVGHDPDAYQALAIPPGKALDSRFRAGFRHLQHLNMSCDLLCTHTMLDEVVDLARTFPDVPIILNHLAGPIGIGRFSGKRSEVFADWRTKIAALAQCRNVAMKLSGFGADVIGFGWNLTDKRPDSATVETEIHPYVHAAIDAFSPSRCMVGSNFPVDRQSFTYAVLWNALKSATKNYTREEQTELFSGTATRIYRLAN